MPDSIHVMGAYWGDSSDEPTPLGELVGAAKDLGSEEALTTLRYQLAEFVSGLEISPSVIVVPVPPGPGRDGHPVPALAAEVASALGTVVANLVSRANQTARLRDTPPSRRQAIVESAGYVVEGSVEGRVVVLVDDVVLTTTTVAHIAGLLREAGAAAVVAIVVAQTRQADTGP